MTRRHKIDHGPVPLLVGLSVMLVWGGTPVFTKMAAAEIDPVVVALLRTILAGAVAIPLVLAMRQPLPKERRSLLLLAVSGAAGFIGFPLIFSWAQRTTSAMHGALILATLPVFTAIWAAVLERRKPTLAWTFGCVLALAGEAALILVRNGGHQKQATLTGDLLVVLSSIVCSAGYVAGARLGQRGYAALPTTLWGVGLSAVVLAPGLGWSVLAHGWPHAGARAWAAVGVLAFLTSIVGYIAWYWALARGGISRVSSAQFTQPLFGLALAVLLLGERPTLPMVPAAAAVLAGVWIVQRSHAAGTDAHAA